MTDLSYIVDKLNQPPFSYNLSLLSFRWVAGWSLAHSRFPCVYEAFAPHPNTLCTPLSSEETPQELLQLLSDVFTQISPKHQVG